jgi:TRAP-type C4-dicarboxylate transport system permease small subunit
MTFAGVARLVLRDLPRFAIGAILLLCVGINAANIIGRYLFLAPLPWAEEVLSVLIIWAVCLGASAVTYDRRHLAMDIFVPLFSPGLRRAADGLVLVATVAFCSFAAWQAWTIVQIMARNGQVSVTAEIPMTVPYFGFVAGFVMIVLAALVRVAVDAKDDTGVHAGSRES